MKDGRYRIRSKEETDAMTFEEKTRYFQELMRELKKREDELDRVNTELAEQRARDTIKPVPAASRRSDK